MITLGITFIFLIIALKWWFSGRNCGDLDKIPRHRQRRWIWSLEKDWDPIKTHLTISSLKQKYGPIFRIVYGGIDVVVISDYEAIHQVLVKSGKEFGGRITNFQNTIITGNTGIAFNLKPDKTWKELRKVTQKQLKQFGDGLSKLEDTINDVATDMLQEFQDTNGQPFDPSKTIFDAAVKNIALLLTGEHMCRGDPLVEYMREYVDIFPKIIPELYPKHFRLFVMFPILRYIGFDQWKPFQRLKTLTTDIWEIIKSLDERSQEGLGIYRVFREHMSTANNVLTESDLQFTCITLLLAGAATTSSSFKQAVNILAHNRDVQVKLYLETSNITKANGRQVTLADRQKMPYTRAFLLEVLRYTSIAAVGAIHKSLEDVILVGYKIPVNTPILTSLWNLHMNEAFWGDPFTFRPDRFLGAAGDLVAADHPNRTHLLPFGAGTRVCVGESLAMARLFIWTSTLVAQFEVTPGANDEKSNTDPRRCAFDGIMKSLPFEVHFNERIHL